MVTAYPLAVKSLPNDAEMIPLPNYDVTPPVTKMYFVGDLLTIYSRFCLDKNTICKRLFSTCENNY